MGDMIPPQKLRDCGDYCKSDEDWIATGDAEVERMVARGLTADSTLLEIGCGAGRFAAALRRRFGAFDYWGVDVLADRIAWCRDHLGMSPIGFQFQYLDMQNDRYNPDGGQPEDLLDTRYDAFVDFIYTYAVFLHLLPVHTKAYLRRCCELLAPGGEMFATFHVEPRVPDVTINPKGYPEKWMRPGQRGRRHGERDALHAVRYSWPKLSGMIEDAGLCIVRVTDEPWRKQTGLYLRRVP